MHRSALAAGIGGLLLALASGTASARTNASIAWVRGGSGQTGEWRQKLPSGRDYAYEACGEGSATLTDPHGRRIVGLRPENFACEGHDFRTVAGGVYDMRATAGAQKAVTATLYQDCAGDASTRCRIATGAVLGWGGRMIARSDADWYGLEVTEGGTYEIDLTTGNPIDVAVRTADGKTLKRTTTRAGFTSSALTFTAPVTGTCHVSLALHGRAPASYVIKPEKR